MRRLFAKTWFRTLIFDSTDQNLLLSETREGSIFIVSTRDAVIGRGTYGNREAWDFDLLVKAIKFIPKFKTPKVLIDVGANVGSIGITAVKTQIVERAYCIEPDPLNYRLMSAAILLSQVKESVIPINLALGDGGESKLQFELSDENFGDHRVRTRNTTPDTEGSPTPIPQALSDRFNETNRRVIEVPTSSLDSLYDEAIIEDRPGGILLFMDTQGYEGHILRGSRNFLQKPEVSIVMEFWPYGLKRAGKGFEFFVEAVSQSHLEFFVDLKFHKTPQDVTLQNLEKLWDTYVQYERHTDIVLF